MCVLSIKFSKISQNISLCTDVLHWMKEIPGHLKTKEMCLEAVCMDPYSLTFVPDHFKTEKICLVAVHKNPYTLG